MYSYFAKWHIFGDIQQYFCVGLYLQVFVRKCTYVLLINSGWRRCLLRASSPSETGRPYCLLVKQAKLSVSQCKQLMALPEYKSAQGLSIVCMPRISAGSLMRLFLLCKVPVDLGARSYLKRAFICVKLIFWVNYTGKHSSLSKLENKVEWVLPLTWELNRKTASLNTDTLCLARL